MLNVTVKFAFGKWLLSVRPYVDPKNRKPNKA